jgi:STE24 endopeptidase
MDYKQAVLMFSWAVYGFEQYLAFRQYSNIVGIKNVPASVQDFTTQDAFDKMRLYNTDKARFGFVSGLFNQIWNTYILTHNLLPLAWDKSGELLHKFMGTEGEIAQSLVFVTLTTLVSTVIGLPWSLYSNFVIEERHGFNKQTLILFLTDQLKGLAVGAVIGVPLIAGFLKIIHWAGDSFVWYVWTFMMVVQISLVILFPILIQPLFNKFSDLPSGDLRDKIVELAKKVGYPSKKLFVVDGSKRSSHSNAYATGFFERFKRIVIFDTLIEQSTTEEVCAVVGHELGHSQLNHVVQMLLVSQAQLFMVFQLFSRFIKYQPMYESFGFHSMPILVGFMLFSYLYSPLDAVVDFLLHMVSRKFEFEADKFAMDLGMGDALKSGLIKLHLKNLGNLVPDWMYSAYHYSHPPLVERLAALDKSK